MQGKRMKSNTKENKFIKNNNSKQTGRIKNNRSELISEEREDIR